MVLSSFVVIGCLGISDGIFIFAASVYLCEMVAKHQRYSYYCYLMIALLLGYSIKYVSFLSVHLSLVC